AALQQFQSFQFEFFCVRPVPWFLFVHDPAPVLPSLLDMDILCVYFIRGSSLDIHIACGIDYGKILVVGHEDCFGDPVNRASKMGEDLAAAGEILVTQDAMQMIPPEAGIKARPMNLSISGITIPAYMIEYRNEEINSAQPTQ
ncbi:MAG TPA: hypothetical protein VK206_00475, partial [Anaerolineales bacterium]|nr:hypothetical protein [Anaerolineales bacterium]